MCEETFVPLIVKKETTSMKSSLHRLQARKAFLTAVIGVALALPVSAQTPAVLTASGAASQKPNIVIILADDFGWGSLGCYGAPEQLRTPHLDRLAREGRRFTDVYNAGSVCSPSRYALMTGRYYWRTDRKDGRVLNYPAPLHIETNRLTLASLCKAQGYRTGAFGKWHLGLQAGPGNADWNKPLTPGPREVGFDYFFGLAANPWNGPHTYIENDSLVGRIPGQEVRVTGGHNPNSTTSGIRKQYETQYIMETLTDRVTDWIEENGSERFFVYYAPTATHTPIDPNPRFTGSPFGKYGDFIEELDWSVGQILTQLDKLQLADNTLVIFTSDDGAALRESKYSIAATEGGFALNGPFRGGKHSEWEGGFRVPFLARWPGKIPAGTVSEQVFCLSDMLATIANLLDVPLSKGSAEDSFDVWRFFTEEKPGQPLPYVITQAFFEATYAIRMDDWKLIERAAPKQNELYNLKDDIAETKDVFAANADRAAQMQKVLSEARDRSYTRPGAGR
jgi:arylsulfatase A